MRRFFISSSIVEEELITLRGTEARHISTVLRLRPGQQVEFFDGTGRVYLAILKSTAPDKVTAELLDIVLKETDDQNLFPLTFVQGLLKGKKMDLIVQKATELGVASFIAVVTRYCENKGGHERQVERWNRIMLEACKQCKRPIPMAIHPVRDVKKIDCTDFVHKYVAWEREQGRSLSSRISLTKGNICLCVGPEGGWHDDEVNYLTSVGFQTFSLGANILRGETAAISAMAVVRYLTGNLGGDTS